MSSINPPSYEFPTIDFNSSYFTSTNTGSLTQSQANALYLQKTVQDSASAVETFTGGILADSIQSITGTSSIFSTTMSSLSIGSLASAISCGGSSTTTTMNGSLLTSNAVNLAVGDNSTNIPSTNWVNNFWVLVKGQANTWSQVNTFSSSILCPIVNYSGTMNIGNSATTLNIGTETNRTAGIHIGDGNTNTSGVVHIANGTSNNTTNAVRILDGTGSTGSVNIGVSGTTTNLNGTVNVGGALTCNSTATISGTATLNGTANLNGTTNITSQVNTNPIVLGSVATSSTQMGYQLSASGSATSTGTTVFIIGAGLTSLPVGTYILNGSCSFPSATFTFIKVCFYASSTLQTAGTSIAAGSNNVPYGSLIINESSQVGSGINLYPLSAVINCVSGTQFYSIMANMNPVSAVSMTMNITATRIS